MAEMPEVIEVRIRPRFDPEVIKAARDLADVVQEATTQARRLASLLQDSPAATREGTTERTEPAPGPPAPPRPL